MLKHAKKKSINTHTKQKQIYFGPMGQSWYMMTMPFHRRGRRFRKQNLIYLFD